MSFPMVKFPVPAEYRVTETEWAELKESLGEGFSEFELGEFRRGLERSMLLEALFAELAEDEELQGELYELIQRKKNNGE